MSIFGHQFYPTPSHVAQQMIVAAGGDLSKSVVLDPSAGRGDLLDAARWTGKAEPKRLYACEIDLDLAAIVSGKKYQVIANDFMQFQGRADIDVILMNPPFDAGIKHLLHAWSILHEGIIVCLLNSANLVNSNSDTDRLKAVVDMASGTITELGQCFQNSPRTTNVNVTMVVLHKQSQSTFNWGNFDQRSNQDYEIGSESALAPRDAIAARVNAYNYGTKILVDGIKTLHKAAQILDPLFKEIRGGGKALGLILDTLKPDHGAQNCDINSALDTLTRYAWLDVFSATKIGGMVPSNLLKELESKKDGMTKMAFTEANIWSLLESLYNNSDGLRDAAVLRGFELMTKYNEKNRIAEKTWKTNSAFKVRRKFIMARWASAHSTTNYSAWTDMADIDKAMCALTGLQFDRIVQLQHMRTGSSEYRGNGVRELIPHASQVLDETGSPKHNHFQTEFFFVTMYPTTGSAHITFKDEILWQQFNIAVAKHNRWLPDQGETGSRYNTKKSSAKKRQL